MFVEHNADLEVCVCVGGGGGGGGGGGIKTKTIPGCKWWSKIQGFHTGPQQCQDTAELPPPGSWMVLKWTITKQIQIHEERERLIV